MLLLTTLARSMEASFLSLNLVVWSLYPAIFGLAIPSAFGHYGVAETLGRNGSGKTTTLRMIIGIIKHDEGVVLWNGKKNSLQSNIVGYLPEERGLYEKAKISDQLIYFAKLKGMNTEEAKKSIYSWLKKFGIFHYYDKRLETLSKGNQQKIQLIASLLNDPKIILLDEPYYVKSYYGLYRKVL